MTMFLKKKFYILIVCKANVTRSIYMHAYMNKILNRFIFTKKIIIMSAGTNAVNGSPPHEVIRHVANINKLSINNFKSKQISSKMIKKAKSHCLSINNVSFQEADVINFDFDTAFCFRIMVVWPFVGYTFFP